MIVLFTVAGASQFARAGEVGAMNQLGKAAADALRGNWSDDEIVSAGKLGGKR
jgi:hypothetical protein